MDLIEQAIGILRAGGLVAFPTETVYGLGADATNSDAVARIYAVKGRPATNPLICHVADATVAKRYAADWPRAADLIAKAFWPGPITLIVRKANTISDAASAGGATVGLRAPDHPLTLDLLRRFDRPIAGPSANRSTRISPTTAQHVRDDLGDAVDLILDGGPCRVGIESTVLDVSGTTPQLLRPGGISVAQIESILGPVEIKTLTLAAAAPQMSPGQQAIHYAPRTPAYRFEYDQRQQITANPASVLTCEGDPIAYARTLYERLRLLDQLNLPAIFVQMPPNEPRWLAVRDRLTRATLPLSSGDASDRT